jgi:type III secretory pathway component EscU
MQTKNGNYEKALLIAGAVFAVAAVGYFILDSQALPERLIKLTGTSKNNLNAPPTEAVDAVLKKLTEKVNWVSPIINGKPVPLNKSIMLLQKGDQLFDLAATEPVLRAPMSNEFIIAINCPILNPRMWVP